MYKVIKLIALIYGNIIFGLGYIFPKSRKVWVFGSMGGRAFSDSPKYIYNYLYENKIAINAIWLTRSPNVFTALKKENRRVYYINSLAGLWYSLRASLGIVSHGLMDINRYCSAKLHIVECWHGIPLKPVLLSDNKEKAVQKVKRIKKTKYIFPFLYRQIQYEKFKAICGSGTLANEILIKVFGQNAPILDLGFPRLDGLFLSEINMVPEKLKKIKKERKKVGIYMPTYRLENEFDIVKHFIENSELITASLEKTDAYLFVKIHSFEKRDLLKNSESERIVHIYNEEIKNDIYSVLGQFDFLITDYSSVLFDFLILSRPVFLLVPDREDYIKSNGKFVYDYLDLGLNVYSGWKEYIKEVVLEEEMKREIYSKLSSKIHKYQDGQSSKRNYNHLKTL